MEPARTIITKLGGVAAVSRLARVHRTRVSNWMRPKERGGTGGIIPQRHIRCLLDAAQRSGVALTAEDFFPLENADGASPLPSVPAGECPSPEHSPAVDISEPIDLRRALTAKPGPDFAIGASR